jgi:hypothetical protein
MIAQWAMRSVRALPGSLRLQRAGSSGLVDVEDVGPGQNDPGYYQKLTNLFPAEALALYGTGKAIFSDANLAVVLVGLIVLFVLRVTANTAKGHLDWRSVGVAVASYLLWVTANDAGWIGGIHALSVEQLAQMRKYAALLGAALVFLAPVLAPIQS